jgi:chromosome segregation ATPase
MKKMKFVVFSLFVVVVFGCTNNQSPSGIEAIQQKQNDQLSAIDLAEQYLDSIRNIDSKIEDLTYHLKSKREQINYLNSKKDSILRASEQIRISLEQINSKKINPGIDGVNLKLDELKGQKENLLEQQSLQKQEVLLAEKKIELQKEEKKVYNAQRQALWDKGAPPDDFKKVDSLLAGIDNYLSEQSARLKNLNRSISDIDEQISAIDQQRNSLSNKIRSNYTAQKIYEDYSAEEKARLDEQLISVEDQIKILLSEQADISSQIALSSGDKNYMQIKQDEVKSLEMSENAKLEEIALQKQQLDDKKAKRNKRTFNAFIGILIAALIMYALYAIGKKRKSNKLKK